VFLTRGVSSSLWRHHRKKGAGRGELYVDPEFKGGPSSLRVGGSRVGKEWNGLFGRLWLLGEVLVPWGYRGVRCWGIWGRARTEDPVLFGKAMNSYETTTLR